MLLRFLLSISIKIKIVVGPYSTTMKTINWKRGIAILFLVETFLLTVGVLIHEEIHSLSIYVLSGRFGEIHLFDSVAYSYHTIAVTLPPQGFVVLDTTFFEVIAYGGQFLITGLVAVLLLKKYYSSSDADDRTRKSPISLTR